MFELDRDLGDGQVRIVRVVDVNGDAVPHAVAQIPGTERLAVSDADGHLTFTGLPPMRGAVVVRWDRDDDGVSDAASVAPFVTEAAEVKKNLTDGLFQPPKLVTTGVIIDELKLTSTRRLAGHVTEDGTLLDETRQALVIASPDIEVGEGETVSLPAAASALVARDGTFELRGLLPRPHRLAVYVRNAGDAVVARFGGLVVEGTADVADLVVDVDGDAAVHTTVATTLFGGDERVGLVGVDYIAPNTDPTGAVAPARETEPRTGQAQAKQVLSPPVGLHALEFLTDDGSPGAVASHVAWVAGATAASTLVSLEMPASIDACRTTSEAFADCDHDGVESLLGADGALAGCADTCGDLRGPEAARTCTFGDKLFDCDDDADGVADTDEPRCLGVLLGTDLDEDGLCEPAADWFPGCAANTDEACR